MMPFLLYQLKVALCIAAFTGFYLLVLRKETFHAVNRTYLVLTLLLSLAIPAFNFTPLATETNGILPVILGAVNVYADKMEIADNPEQLQSSRLMILYLVVVVIYAGYFLFHLFHLLLLIRRNGISVQGNHRLIELSEGNESFSFFNLVFIQPDIVRSGQADQVIRHELAHVRQLHSLDILLVQGIKIFQWFNPFMYVMENALKETHEYLADTAVVEQDGRPDRYRLLLLAQVFGVQPGIFNFFNRSLIKNRLTMMTKEKSPSRNRLKYLAALPLVFILGLLMCCSLDQKEEQMKTPLQETAVKLNDGIDPASITDDDSVYVFVDEQARFQEGGLENFREWVQKNVVYPPEAIKNGISGRVTVQFAVNSKGKLCDAKVLRGVDPLIDMAAIEVIKSSPDWIPGKYNGYSVKQQFIMPVIFMLQ